MKSYRAPRFDHSETGQEFGRLTLIGPWFVVRDDKLRMQRVGVFECQCGTITTGRKEDVRYGKKTSCGCRNREHAKELCQANTKHGQSRRMTNAGLNPGSVEYDCWHGIIQRCENPRNISYPRYGGRGIKVCQRWRVSFEAFLADVGKRPSDRHSIDRIEVNGNYEPGNVRWAIKVTQERNKTTNHLVTWNGQTRPVSEWSEITGIPAQTLYKRLERGLPAHDVLTMPVNQEMSRRSKRVKHGCN